MSAEVATLEKRAEGYQDYPEELKAAVIHAIEQNDNNVNGTAKLFQLPPDTVRYWWANSARFREIHTLKTRLLADKCENIAHSLADSIESHDLSIVPLSQKATTLGIVIDKMQLLRGQPTSISESIERQELTVVLQSALAEVIDVTPG